MSTFNGCDENLMFTCGSCKNEIEIDLGNPRHKDKLWDWLFTHSECGGIYKNVKINHDIVEALKKPVAQRTEREHLLLVSYYGGVREYLLTMGHFKISENMTEIDNKIVRIRDALINYPYHNECSRQLDVDDLINAVKEKCTLEKKQ